MDLLFGFKGRIARVSFLLTSVAIWVAIAVMERLATMIIDAHPLTDQVQTVSVQAEELTGPEAVVALIVVLMAIAISWTWLAVTTKRLHDVNLSGWLSLPLALVGPLTIFLSIFPGTPGDNDYGHSPGDEVGDVGAELTHIRDKVSA